MNHSLTRSENTVTIIMLLFKKCNKRNNYAGSTWYHIKHRIIKELSSDIVCLFEIIYVIFIYHYISAN